VNFKVDLLRILPVLSGAAAASSMADPKDKKISALEAKIVELQSILPPVNDIKAQLEERKAACRALKTQA
jgi:hypothetical protein